MSCQCFNPATNAEESCLLSSQLLVAPKNLVASSWGKRDCRWLGSHEIRSGSVPFIFCLLLLAVFPTFKRHLLKLRGSRTRGKRTTESLLLGRKEASEDETVLSLSYDCHDNLALTLQDSIERNAITMPNAPALIQLEGDAISFIALENWSVCIACEIADAGIEFSSGSAIVVSAFGCSIVASIIGVWKTGNPYVPLAPTLPQKRIRFIIDDVAARMLLTDVKLWQSLEVTNEYDYKHVSVVDIGSLRNRQQQVQKFKHTCSGGELAFVLYTSGSTGKPKGVRMEHHAMMNRFKWQWNAYPFLPSDVCLSWTSIAFVDHVFEIFGGLSKGVPLVMEGSLRLRTDLRKTLQVMSEHHVSHIIMVPSLLRELISASHLHSATLSDALPSLRQVTVSGEALPCSLVEDFLKDVSVGVKLLNTWGTTEIAADATFAEFMHGALMPSDCLAPIGISISNVTIHVLDPKTWQPVPCGATGELFVCGACLANGYVDRQEEEREHFVALQDGTRAFRTGDFGKIDSKGVLTFVGRSDQQVKINGQRVEVLEVELALNSALQASSSSKDAKGIVVATQASKDQDTRLVAFVAPSGNADELRSEMMTELPPAWVPQGIHVVQKLPMLPTGKVNRLELQVKAQEISKMEPQFQILDSMGMLKQVGEDSIFALTTLKIAYFAAIVNVMISHWISDSGAFDIFNHGVWMNIFFVGLGANAGILGEAYWTRKDTYIMLLLITFSLWGSLLLCPASLLLNTASGSPVWKSDGGMCTDRNQELWFFSWYIFVRGLFVALNTITSIFFAGRFTLGVLQTTVVFTVTWGMGEISKGRVDRWFDVWVYEQVPWWWRPHYCMYWWPYIYSTKMVLYLLGFHFVAPALPSLRRFSPQSLIWRFSGLVVALGIWLGLLLVPGIDAGLGFQLWSGRESLLVPAAGTVHHVLFGDFIKLCQVAVFLIVCSLTPFKLAELGQCSLVAYISHTWMGQIVMRYGIALFGLTLLPSLDTVVLYTGMGRLGLIFLSYIYAVGYMVIVALPLQQFLSAVGTGAKDIKRTMGHCGSVLQSYCSSAMKADP